MTPPSAPGPAPEPAPTTPAPLPGGAAAPGGAPPSGGDASPPPGTDGAAAEQSYAIGAGGEEADSATASYGEGSRRGEYLRGPGGWDFGGDYVGRDKEHVARDKNVYNMFGTLGARRESRQSELPSRLSGLIRDAFVAPECLAEVRAASEKRRTVVLRGPAGFGKHGLAIHMLMQSCQKLFQIDPSADLTRLREWIETGDGEQREVTPEAGFILDHPQDKAHLDGSVLQGLEELLERAGARLILTVGPEGLASDGLHEYVIDVRSPPDCEQVLERHLRYHLGERVATRVLARDDIRLFIGEKLATHAACRVAADLAADIADDFSTTKMVEDIDVGRIREVTERRGAETFDTWFTRLGDTESRCFAVALAVLNGAPYDAVAKAARMLYQRFDTATYAMVLHAHEPPPDGQRPFVLSRQDWLHRLQARVKGGGVEGSAGKTRAEIVEYRDRAYPQQVIRRAWSDFRAQGEVLGWLGDLAVDPSVQVRIIAGKALGLLALWSFDHLSQSLLGRWAANGTPHQREAVAYALMVAAREADLHGNVKQLVAGWYGDPGKPVAQATAARVYGLARGVFDPDEALAALDLLATVDDVRVAVAVGDALADLLEDSDDDFACHVLGGLARCLDDREKSGTVQLAFLILTTTLVTQVRTGPRGPEVSWPYLLRLASEQPRARTALVCLWRFVINGTLLVDQAYSVMTRWANATGANPQAQEAFLRLVMALAADDQRSRMILIRYAGRWVTDEKFKPLAGASAAVRAILDAERSPR